MSDRLLPIASVFGAASLLAFGGTNAIVPQLQLKTVDQYGWLTDRQFADSFAIAQVTPGPSTMLVTLLGYKADGVSGALLATVAMTVPASILAWIVTRFWLKSGKSWWHDAFEHGLSPIGVGLVAAAGFIVARGIDHNAAAWSMTIAAGVLLIATKINPLVVVAAGGAIGVLFGGT